MPDGIRESPSPAVLAVALACLLPVSASAQGVGPRPDAGDELRRLRGELIALNVALAQHNATLLTLQRDVKRVGEDLATVKEIVGALSTLPVVANSFLVSPPPGADALGVAKAVLFEPRLQLESARRHDTLFVTLRRIEPADVKLIAQLELGASETGLDLPIDRNGALYAVEWSTEEGFSFTLSLQDGASEQIATSVQVRPLQNRGRFLFVGSRLQ